MAHALFAFCGIVSLSPPAGPAEAVSPEVDRAAHEFVACPVIKEKFTIKQIKKFNGPPMGTTRQATGSPPPTREEDNPTVMDTTAEEQGKFPSSLLTTHDISTTAPFEISLSSSTASEQHPLTTDSSSLQDSHLIENRICDDVSVEQFPTRDISWSGGSIDHQHDAHP